VTNSQAKLALAAAAIAAGILILAFGHGQTLVNDQWAYLSPYRDWEGVPAPELIGSSGGGVRRRGDCLSLLPQPGLPTEVRLRLEPGGLAYRSREPVRVRLGRFGDSPSVALPPRSGRVDIPIPPDRSRLPWTAELRIGARALACSRQ